MFVYCLACELYAQFLEDLDIYVREHYGSVSLTSVQLRKLRECKARFRAVSRAGGERNQYFVSVQTRVFAL